MKIVDINGLKTFKTNLDEQVVKTLKDNVADIENRITQNSSNLETAKQELSNKCNEALSEAKAYTDQEKAKLFNSTNGTFKGAEYNRNVANSYLRLSGGNTRNGGAVIHLYGKDATNFNGIFAIGACSTNDSSDYRYLQAHKTLLLTHWKQRNKVKMFILYQLMRQTKNL